MSDRKAGVSGLDGKPKVFEMVGQRLRDYYDEVARQPVPERFLELLKELDSKPPPVSED